MPVKGIVAGVELAAREPAVKRLAGIIKDFVPLPVPVPRTLQGLLCSFQKSPCTFPLVTSSIILFSLSMIL
jgi:hypothetical protein